ncbi:MAG TPA: heterodisulfide reductase-related iron-sulfur binding cluster [Geothermobacteraceae bacterium]|nr:heterodisulfide reductase-related iron-sulfur binding cluster [Geothermobacteraceae bacterium]
MELTREIYWNVGHGVLLPMYLLVLAAFGVLAWGFWQRIKVYRQGQKLDRRDDLAGRIAAALRQVVTQHQVMRVVGAGSAHGMFFFAFVLLAIGTTLVFIQADLLEPLLGVKFLIGNFYLLFSLVLDLAGLVAIVMLFGLLVRRYLVRPEGLPTAWDNALMQGLLLAILVTGFVVEGARIAVTELGTPLAAWSPVGLVLAKAMAGLSEASLRSLHSGSWWLHFALVLGFFVAIPFTRFRHLLTTSANYVFADRRPKGSLATLDLEDESAESFGTATLADLSWKDILDSDACTYCKRCQDRCPAFATDKPLSPMQLVNQIQEVAFTHPEASLPATVTSDVLWSCTTCRACQEICPATIEHVPKIIDMRRNLVLMEGEFPGEEVQKAIDNTEVNGNPLGMGYSSRGDWAVELGVPSLAEDAEVDLLYFVGCYASFDKRNIKVAKAFVQLCQAAGLKVGILGKEEKCCGEPMRKLGNEYLYQMLAAENIELINDYGVKQIVTSCPHCFQTLNNDYRDLGLETPVLHYTVFLDQLIGSGQLRITAEKFDCTYHDSCYLGRYNDLFVPPRNLIRAAGGTLTEMAKSGLESFCCGAGGGRILAEEKLGSRISEKRAAMAAGTGAQLLVSNCPFCLTMFEDGVKGAGFEEQLAPKDLAELLAERI